MKVLDGDGNQIHEYRYGPYGNLEFSKGSSDNRYIFTGKEWDAESGLFYFGARYYDPSIGRWISKDPMDQFYSEYSYCGNDPLHSVDPWGLEGTFYMSEIQINADQQWTSTMDYLNNQMGSQIFSDGQYMYMHLSQELSTYRHVVSSKELVEDGHIKIDENNYFQFHNFINSLDGDWTNVLPDGGGSTTLWRYKIAKPSIRAQAMYMKKSGGTIMIGLNGTGGVAYASTAEIGFAYSYSGYDNGGKSQFGPYATLGYGGYVGAGASTSIVGGFSFNKNFDGIRSWANESGVSIAKGPGFTGSVATSLTGGNSIYSGGFGVGGSWSPYGPIAVSTYTMLTYTWAWNLLGN